MTQLVEWHQVVCNLSHVNILQRQFLIFGQHGGAASIVVSSQLQSPGFDPDLRLLSVWSWTSSHHVQKCIPALCPMVSIISQYHNMIADMLIVSSDQQITRVNIAGLEVLWLLK